MTFCVLTRALRRLTQLPPCTRYMTCLLIHLKMRFAPFCRRSMCERNGESVHMLRCIASDAAAHTASASTFSTKACTAAMPSSRLSIERT